MLSLILLSEEVPQTDLTWLLLAALGFFLLMIVVGWLVSRNKPEAPAAEAHGHDDHGH
ncbi:MAG: hypothetical protein AB1846_03610 [Chloroflexota bacterium]